MPGPAARPARMMKLTHKETGEVVERWPVDAREMLETGDWEASEANTQILKQRVVGTGTGEYTPPPDQATDPVPHKTAAEEALKHNPHHLMNEAAARAEAGEEAPPDIPPEETEGEAAEEVAEKKAPKGKKGK